MKRDFFDYMHVIMDKNPDVYLILCGLGYPRVDEFLEKYPGRAINTEASEQASLDIAVGLAYAGKVPFVYTITPFLYRGFETIRTYINHETLNVKLVGVGRDDDYSKHDGFSHDAKDASPVFTLMHKIEQHYPETPEEMKNNINWMVETSRPAFLSIRR